MTKHFVIRNFRGKCSAVGILNGNIANTKLGTPALNGLNFVKQRKQSTVDDNFRKVCGKTGAKLH